MPGTKVKDVGGRPLKLQVGVKKCWVLIPFQGLHPEKNRVQKDVCTPVFTAALFTKARTWKQLKCPLMDK